MRKIFRAVPLHKGRMALLVMMTALMAVIEMVMPALMQRMVNGGVLGENMGVLYQAAGLMLAAALALGGMQAGLAHVAAWVSARFGADLRRKLFDALQTYAQSNVDALGAGSLLNRMMDDVGQVQTFLTFVLRMGVQAPLLAAAGVLFSNATDTRASRVLLVAAPLMVLIMCVLAYFVVRTLLKLKILSDRMNQSFIETLEGLKVIRAFNRQQTMNDSFAQKSAEHRRLNVRQSLFMSALMPAMQLIFGLTTVGVMFIGAKEVTAGAMTVGELVSNQQYVSLVLMAVVMVIGLLINYPTTRVSAQRMNEMLAVVPAVQDGTADFAGQGDSLVFEGAGFQYPGADRPVLHDVSFEAKRGTVTAIVGRTASGKSTLFKLIERLYDVTEGRILLDGQDISTLRVADLRRCLAYVPQKSHLFQGDLAFNLNMGKADGAERDWQRACYLACCEDVIEKKGGYAGTVAPMGQNLSGGQRQRMAMARAVMKDAPIYLFDDSFSALDLKTDVTVRRRLAPFFENKVVLIIAQRIATVMHADQILVLDGGRVVGKGRHEELLQTCPLYRDMARLQLGEAAQ